MVESTGKLAVGLVLLVVLWIGVYWLYEPKPAPISQADAMTPVSITSSFSPFAPEAQRSKAEFEDPSPRRVAAVPPPRMAEPNPSATRVTEPPLVLGNPTPMRVASSASTEPPAVVENAQAANAASPGVMNPTPAAISEPEGAPIKVIPPEMIKYAIQKGDTFEAISERFYGTRDFASAVAKANPFTSPDRLREGRVINIPKDPNNIYGVSAPAGMKFDATIAPAPGTPRPPATPTAAAPTNAPAAGPPKTDAPKPPTKQDDLPHEYVVQSGDTLSGISKKIYGTTKNANRIFEANRKILDSADDLREGQTLVLPPREEAGN